MLLLELMLVLEHLLLTRGWRIVRVGATRHGCQGGTRHFRRADDAAVDIVVHSLLHFQGSAIAIPALNKSTCKSVQSAIWVSSSELTEPWAKRELMELFGA